MELPSISELVVHQKAWVDEEVKGQYILGIDPGQTTGICLIDHSNPQKPLFQGQIKTYPHRTAYNNLLGLIEGWRCDDDIRIQDKRVLVAMEDYRVYAWKSADHQFSELYTPQLIGALKWTCIEFGWPVCMQMAQLPKKFVTNDKLKKWNIDPVGKTHARDATRHAIYHAIFGGSYADIK